MKKWLVFLLAISCFMFPGRTFAAQLPMQPDWGEPVHVIADNSFLDLGSPAFLINGRVMISLQSLQGVFECEAFAQPGEIKIISHDTFITMFPGSNDYLVNSAVSRTDTAPLITGDDQVYVPLRTISEEFQYAISYDPETRRVLLQSPNYQKKHPLDPGDSPKAVPEVIEFKPSGNWGAISGANPLIESDQLIAGYFTRLINSPRGRTTNIILSCASINGSVIQPGEVFSFNETVGPRTSSSGYQTAAIFSGQQVIDGVGGGVCQTATTLYNLALEANLKIIERHPHSLKVTYTAPGRDATVSWGTADLRFVNTFVYPIKILCRVEADLVMFALIKA
ncbi:MAG TPA: VanW family protein [Syntrophomonadaceae bacterium]|nr:VanW family protein [Syntrophomonadaceae bacterium]